MEQAIRNEAFAAKLALTYGELFDGISPVKQRVALRIEGRILKLMNPQTHTETRWNLDEMCEIPNPTEPEVLTFSADHGDPARLTVRELDALREFAQSGARFPVARGRKGGLRNLVLAILLLLVTVFGLIPMSAVVARMAGEDFASVWDELQNAGGGDISVPSAPSVGGATSK